MEILGYVFTTNVAHMTAVITTVIVTERSGPSASNF